MENSYQEEYKTKYNLLDSAEVKDDLTCRYNLCGFFYLQDLTILKSLLIQMKNLAVAPLTFMKFLIGDMYTSEQMKTNK